MVLSGCRKCLNARNKSLKWLQSSGSMSGFNERIQTVNLSTDTFKQISSNSCASSWTWVWLRNRRYNSVWVKLSKDATEPQCDKLENVRRKSEVNTFTDSNANNRILKSVLQQSGNKTKKRQKQVKQSLSCWQDGEF